MADEKTHADAIRVYLTGASSHGGAQSDPDASLGNHQSSTEAAQVSWNVSNPISNISVDLVSAANGLGAGSLTASGSDTLRWTPPGGTQGVDVTIANGETKLIEAGNNEPEKCVRVSRTSATALSGTATVTISDSVNNLTGFDDVSSAEASAGDDEYRCLCIENVSSAEVKSVKLKLTTQGTQRTTDAGQLGASGAGTIQTTGSFADWPEVGWAAVKDSGGSLREVVYYSSRTSTVLTVPSTGRGRLGTSAAAGAATDTVDAIPGIRLGLDAPSSQPSGTFVDNTGADEDTAPSGVTFYVPITDAEALSIGDLASTYIYGFWMHREIPASAVAGLGFLNGWQLAFDAA